MYYASAQTILSLFIAFVICTISGVYLLLTVDLLGAIAVVAIVLSMCYIYYIVGFIKGRGLLEDEEQ